MTYISPISEFFPGFAGGAATARQIIQPYMANLGTIAGIRQGRANLLAAMRAEALRREERQAGEDWRRRLAEQQLAQGAEQRLASAQTMWDMAYNQKIDQLMYKREFTTITDPTTGSPITIPVGERLVAEPGTTAYDTAFARARQYALATLPPRPGGGEPAYVPTVPPTAPDVGDVGKPPPTRARDRLVSQLVESALGQYYGDTGAEQLLQPLEPVQPLEPPERPWQLPPNIRMMFGDIGRAMGFGPEEVRRPLQPLEPPLEPAVQTWPPRRRRRVRVRPPWYSPPGAPTEPMPAIYQDIRRTPYTIPFLR